jgi:hypothetical protein
VIGYSWTSGVLLIPLRHGSGIDDVLCLVVPMLVLGAVFLFVMRRSAAEEEDGAEPEPAGETLPTGSQEQAETARDDVS